MSDQELTVVDRLKKDEKGRFGAGNNANPTGKGGPRKGWTPFATRIKHIAEAKTAMDVMATVVDQKAFSKLPVMDAIIYARMAESIKPTGINDAKMLVEYTDGKPDAKLNVTHAGKFTFGQESVSEINSWISGITGRQEDTVPEDTEQE